MSKTLIWAHRGARKERPENTLEAFKRAIELGVDGFELDVQRTKDGQLVVIHDETLDRVSFRAGQVVDLSWEELQGYNVAAFRSDKFGEMRVPLLREVLELIQGTKLLCNIELKNSVVHYHGMEDQVIALVKEMGLEEQVLYSTFSPQSVMRLVRRVGRDKVGFLYERNIPAPVGVCRFLGAGALHPDKAFVTHPRYVERAHRAGRKVHVWTVNAPEDMARLAKLGVDALITDDPALALAARKDW